jgi:hypothetical protein
MMPLSDPTDHKNTRRLIKMTGGALAISHARITAPLCPPLDGGVVDGPVSVIMAFVIVRLHLCRKTGVVGGTW